MEMEGNLTVEKAEKHYVSQVIKVSISNKSPSMYP